MWVVPKKLLDRRVSILYIRSVRLRTTFRNRWEYVRANGLQKPSDGRVIVCNNEMKQVFFPGNGANLENKEVHMFSLSKLLTPHLGKP
mmetsp:Transcript_42010/g.82374  ORF Transcript_42010/g.82374 Transcript_42010/m.82374 type:complete len:88 (-) Transcript_42010:216-479(-)